MNILLAYGTTEGHTLKISNFAAECLTQLGHSVIVSEANRAPTDLAGFNAIILAARVHAGRHHRAVIDFASTHREALRSKPSAFLSVSMSAALLSPGDSERLADYRSSLTKRTGWAPASYHDVAGARLYTRHNLIARWILGVVDRGRFDTSHDHEFTDWEDLRAFLRDWSRVAVDEFSYSAPPSSS
jgi:menaquinone-dependent protoporphyrinogen oxidase